MNPILLTEYIKHGMVLTNLAGRDLYDAVVYESFDNNKIELPKDLPVISLASLGVGTGISGKVIALQKEHKNILLVLEKTPTAYVSALLEQPQEKGKKITIVQLSSGISGTLTCGKPINNDLCLAQQTGVPVHGPHDMVQFFALLEKEGNSYIRIQQGEYLPTLMANLPAENEGGLYSMTTHGLSGSDGTIIVGGRVANELLYACTKLQEMSAMYDCFLATEWTWAITDSLRNSLLVTERLIIVADANDQYVKQYAQSKLFESGMYDVEVIVLSPQFDGTTTQVEYIYEQAGFGVEAFVTSLTL